MSLLHNAFIPCTMVEKKRVPDGAGGLVTSWVDGAPFEAAVILDNSLQARVAQSQGVTGIYTVTTRRGVILGFHDVFRRNSDGKIFRVTSDGEDNATPKSAGLDMRQVSAEEWTLT